MDLLLLSNSTNCGQTIFSHAAEEMVAMAAGDTVTFIPFALDDWDGYGERVSAALGRLGIDVASAHRCDSPDRAILEADVVLVGGGNTFRLLDTLCRLNVLDGLSRRVREGHTRYLGSSAGTNVACPTIRTTNDMPICQPPSFAALGLLPFQVNLHYVDPDPHSTYMGESRDERIEEFLEENDCPVLALYEGSWLRVSGAEATVHGPGRLFRRNGRDDPVDGDDVTPLLRATPSYDRGSRPERAIGPSHGRVANASTT
ncbi:MAG: dipeptidase PepE [Acidimicrobiales bacterium]